MCAVRRGTWTEIGPPNCADRDRDPRADRDRDPRADRDRDPRPPIHATEQPSPTRSREPRRPSEWSNPDRDLQPRSVRISQLEYPQGRIRPTCRSVATIHIHGYLHGCSMRIDWVCGLPVTSKTHSTRTRRCPRGGPESGRHRPRSGSASPTQRRTIRTSWRISSSTGLSRAPTATLAIALATSTPSAVQRPKTVWRLLR